MLRVRLGARSVALLSSLLPLSANAQSVARAPVRLAPTATPTPRPAMAGAGLASFDECRQMGCQPRIVSLEVPRPSATLPQEFGMYGLTLIGKGFGNVRGKVRLTVGGSVAEVAASSWKADRIAISTSGWSSISGIPGGAGDLRVQTTDGSLSNAMPVTFVPGIDSPEVPASVMVVDSCSATASQNQCNQMKNGEGDVQPFAYNQGPAVFALHYDHCTGPFCLNGARGVDGYSLPPLKNGFRIKGFEAKVVTCGFISKGRSYLEFDQVLKNPGACKVSVRKLDSAADRGNFLVEWENQPKVDVVYKVVIWLNGPKGLKPW